MKRVIVVGLLVCGSAIGQAQQMADGSVPTSANVSAAGTPSISSDVDVQAAPAQKNDDNKKGDSKADAKKKSDSDDLTVATIVGKGAWEWGGWVQGGTGVGKRSSTDFIFFGARGGRVLTSEHLPGFLRGTFELAAEVIPFEHVKQPLAGTSTNGMGFNPVILKWNFTSGKRIIPYAEIAGGILVTGQDVPPGTNTLNFTPQGGMGFHFLRDKKKQAVTAAIKYLHVSNAGLANGNSGINAAVVYTLGYTWFR